MLKYVIKQSGGDTGVRDIGSIDWSPEGWNYQTSDAEVDRILGEVKAKGEVAGYTSFEDEDVEYCFVEYKVESSSPEFMGQLSDYIGRKAEHVWVYNQLEPNG
ncbi:hypothetical protein M1O55_01645 [Dehalococcoidia bacterium]|nr:hypothetical protein [Dehalococcoidia bacterium]